MGRPINPRKIGDPAKPGLQVTSTVLVDVGEGVEGGVILRQRSNNRYLVEGVDSSTKLVCKLVNGVPAAVGEMSVAVFNSLVAPIVGQDETDYDGAGSNGTFSGGAGYAATDTITLTGGTVVTVNDVDGGGAVTEFEVSVAGSGVASGSTLVQTATSGSGTGFELELGDDNEEPGAIDYARNINNRTVKTFGGVVYAWPKNVNSVSRVTADIQSS